jgi:hypothetical protein
MAECAGIVKPEVKCDKGSCSDTTPICSCTKQINPICCENEEGIKQDYDNPCLAECAGFTEPAEDDTNCILGTCKETHPCGCELIYEPICCDNVDYSSICDAECEGIENAAESCKQEKCSDAGSTLSCDDCTREYSPYCCNEINDYNNKCLAECDNKDIEQDCKVGSCVSMGCECEEEEYDPYCCDGITYDNECVAKCNDKDCVSDCEKGMCQTYDGAASYTGIFSLGKPSGTSQWNIMIVIIQLCILAVCCLSLGLSISFCFKNPNKLLQSGGKQSFGRDQ